MLKVTIHDEDISFVNTYVTNDTVTIFIMQKLREMQ